MKLRLITGAFCLTLLLVLTEATAAPSCENSDDVLYKKTEKESETSSKRELQEESDLESERYRASNGLVSGRKEVSFSTAETELEQERSRSASLTNTADSSKKVEESAKKKLLNKNNQKKSMILYYIVSYRRLPKQKPTETKKEYYQRLFPKEEDIKIFYHKIFKVYEKEKPKQYIERIEYIFDHVYPELDPRLDVRYCDFFDHYYTTKYCRKVNEKDKYYYARVLKRLYGEKYADYLKRMTCLVTSLDEEDFTHIKFVDTELGFIVGERKSPVTSVSSPTSSGIKEGNFKSITKKTKKEVKTINADRSTLSVEDNAGSSLKAQQSVKSTREVVEKEEDIDFFSYKVAYTKLPKKKVGQSDEDYYRNFFGVCGKNVSEEDRNELFLRILIQYKGETNKEYVDRVDFVFDKVYPYFDIRTNKLFSGMLEHYYRAKYKKSKKETEDQWLSRILKKQPNETEEHYIERLECMDIICTDIDFSRVVIDAKSETGFTLKPKVEEKKCSS